MDINVSGEIPFPRQLVFDTYRDRLPQLVPHLHNVRAIEVKSRTEEAHVTTMVNRWKGGGELPAAVRKFVAEHLLEWEDQATWDARAYTCDWRTLVPAFKDAVEASGRTTYLERGPRLTAVQIVGRLTVDASAMRVPRLLAGTLGSAAESFLVARIQPNLVAVAEGVRAFLATEESASRPHLGTSALLGQQGPI